MGHYELGAEKLAVAFVTDITDQVKSKKIVAEREAWFRNVADNSPVMIWVSGTDKLRNYFNKSWIEYTGHSLETETGNGWEKGIHPEDLKNYLFTYHYAFDARKPFKIEYQLRRKDGQFRWIHEAGKPTFSSEKDFTGFIGSCSDIHDQRMMKEELELLVKQRTQELTAALKREKELNDLKSKFVSMASHEFRTPLSIVLSSTSLIELFNNDQEKNEKISKHLLRIKSSVKNLETILNDFLSLDKLEQENTELEYNDFDVAAFLNDLVEDIDILHKKNQCINYSHNGESQVIMDKKKLQHIMMNLLSNSIKYSSEDTEINLCSENIDYKFTITIKDQGIGIPEEEQKNMFSKFFRAKNTGNIQGTGLGLTIVKKYVELMMELFSLQVRPVRAQLLLLKFLKYQ
ncbi:hypothetical protein BH23BAC2_BH23BAC2_01640 [soil metagenome]